MESSVASSVEPDRPLSAGEVHQCALRALESQLPQVNHLLESSFNQLSSTFVEMSDQLSLMLQNVAELAAQPDLPEAVCATLRNVDSVSATINRQLNEVIVGMQFQDRVSQNLVIAINVMKFVADALEKHDLDPNDHQAHELLELLKLGEVKQQFLDHLILRGHGEFAAGVGGGFHGHTPDEEDVELF